MVSHRQAVKTIFIIFVLSLFSLNFLAGKSLSYAQNIPASLHSIKGQISAAPSFAILAGGQETLILPTNSGLYLIQEGKIMNHFLPGREILSVTDISDQNHDGDRDLVISVKDSILPNVFCLSGRTGDILWRFSPESKAFAEGLGWVYYQPEKVMILPAGQNEQFIYLYAGEVLYQLSTENGNVIWQHTEEYQISSLIRISDLDGDKTSELCIGNALGEIIVLGSQAGRETWRDKIGLYVTDNPLATGGRQTAFTGDSIWVIQRDGRLRAYHPDNGKVIWQKRFKELTGISAGDLEIAYTGKIDGDEYPDVIVKSDQEHKIWGLNGNTGNLIWEYEVAGSSLQMDTLVNTAAGSNALFVLSPTLSKVQRYTLLDLTKGQKVKEGIIPLEFNQASFQELQYILPDRTGRLLFAGFASDIVLFDQGITYPSWSLPRFYDRGYLLFNSPAQGSLLLYANSQAEADHKKIGLVQKIAQDGQMLWEFQLDKAQLYTYKGLAKLQVVADLDQDGAEDLIGALFSEEYPEADRPAAQITAISGKMGGVLWQTDLQVQERVTSLFPLQDVNNDDLPEIMVATSSQFYLLDGASGKIAKNWPHYNQKEKTYFEPTKDMAQRVVLAPAGDVNKDAINDVFVLAAGEIRLGLTNKVGGIDFYYKELCRLSQGEYDIERVRILPDLDGDGVPELSLPRKLGDAEDYLIISGSGGRTMISYTGSNAVIRATGVDFNRNGVQDVLCYEDLGNGQKGLKVLEGANGNVLWSHPGFSGQHAPERFQEMPGCVIDDLNGDSIPELAVVKSSETGTGMLLEIFDIAGGWQQPYKTYVIQQSVDGRMNRPWIAGYALQKVTVEGRSVYAVSGRLGGQNAGGRLIIFDAEKGVSAAIYPLESNQYIQNPNGLTVADFNGKVHLLNWPQNNSDIQLTEGTNVSPVTITWKNSEPLAAQIYVDNVLILETKADTVQLDLTEGEHTIGVARYNLKGEYMFSSFDVNVAKDGKIRNLMHMITIILMGLVFGLPVYLQRRMRAGGRNV